LENPFIGEFWKNKTGSKELRDKFGAGKMPKKEFIEKASKMLNIQKSKFMEEYGKSYFPIKKIDPVFNFYKNLKIKKAIFSDTNPLHLEFIKKTYPDMFILADKIVMSSEIGSRKNQEQSYKNLIKSLNLPPKEILLIDDKQSVLDIAKKQGLKTLLFENVPQFLKDIKSFNLK